MSDYRKRLSFRENPAESHSLVVTGRKIRYMV